MIDKAEDLDYIIYMSRINNLRPEKCARFLIKNGWELVNKKGSHETYFKTINGITQSTQVIWNSKTIHWKNAKEMIKRSGIPEAEWINHCK